MLAGAEAEHAIQHARDGEDVLDGLGQARRVERGHERVEGQPPLAHIVDLQPDGLHEAALGIVVLEVEDADGQAHACHAVDQHVERLRFARARIAGNEHAAVQQLGLVLERRPEHVAPGLARAKHDRWRGRAERGGGIDGFGGRRGRLRRAPDEVRLQRPVRRAFEILMAAHASGAGQGQDEGQGHPADGLRHRLRQEARHIRLDGVMQAPGRRVIPLRLDDDRRRGPEGKRLFDAMLGDADRDKARREHIGSGDGPSWSARHLASQAVELLFCRARRDPIVRQLAGRQGGCILQIGAAPPADHPGLHQGVVAEAVQEVERPGGVVHRARPKPKAHGLPRISVECSGVAVERAGMPVKRAHFVVIEERHAPIDRAVRVRRGDAVDGAQVLGEPGVEVRLVETGADVVRRAERLVVSERLCRAHFTDSSQATGICRSTKRSRRCFRRRGCAARWRGGRLPAPGPRPAVPALRGPWTA